ncbi:hypothetical protein TNCV_534071 [Trichonephila clavipes]|nr:hypothetical protein TNCV_534071 [Trichonephila clavipes]
MEETDMHYCSHLSCHLLQRSAKRFKNTELADLHLIYGLAEENTRAEERLCRERNPQRDCPGSPDIVRVRYFVRGGIVWPPLPKWNHPHTLPILPQSSPICLKDAQFNLRPKNISINTKFRGPIKLHLRDTSETFVLWGARP